MNPNDLLALSEQLEKLTGGMTSLYAGVDKYGVVEWSWIIETATYFVNDNPVNYSTLLVIDAWDEANRDPASSVIEFSTHLTSDVGASRSFFARLNVQGSPVDQPYSSQIEQLVGKTVERGATMFADAMEVISLGYDYQFDHSFVVPRNESGGSASVMTHLPTTTNIK